MANLIEATVLTVISFVAYNQSKKSKAAGENSKATTWMLLAIGVGFFTVLAILG